MKNYRENVIKTFKEHRELSPHEARLLDWTVGLSGETGEVCELVKHHIYGKEDLDKMELAKEIGDVMWYLTALAETAGIHIEDVLELNTAKLAHRHGDKYCDKASKERHAKEQKFEQTETYAAIRNRILGGK